MNNLITPLLDQPRLWIERVEIYGSIDPPELIRGIDFSKGLNIVWGVPNSERKTDEELGIEFNGHSVGKTSLCRLIRYALGEAGFGRKIHEKRINSTFNVKGGGAVAIAVYVDGTRWSVIRPFFESCTSKSSNKLSVEELFAVSHEGNPYGDFEKALHDAFIAPFPAHNPPGTEQEYIWPHLLAWLTRDQEARYQSIWQWRSTRSETRGVPKFSKRKFAAHHLMRTVLALLNDDEARISREMDTCSDELKKLESDRDLLTKSHRDKATYLESVLLAIIPEEDQQLVDLSGDKPLLSLANALDSHIATLMKEITDLLKQREEAHEKLVYFQTDVTFYEDAIKNIQALLAPHKISSDSLVTSPDSNDKLQKMEERLKNSQKCYWSGTHFIDCDKYKASLNILREKFSQFEKSFNDIPDNDQKDHAIKEWIEEESEFSQRLKEARKQVAHLLQEEKKLFNLISKKEGEIRSINNQNTLLQRSKSFAKGIFLNESTPDQSTTDSEHTKDIQKIQELNSNISEKLELLQSLKNRLEQSQQWIWDQGDKLKHLYDQVLKNILSPKLDAYVTLPPMNDFHFGIQESTAVLSGEAIESLSLILFDITALLWSVGGNGFHPCFLMHDSPREADLETPVYNQFLKNIHKISVELGASNAPFQYILTTTSEPPKLLQDDGMVCLQLRAHPEKDMLFGRILERPTLLDEENAGNGLDVETED